jgi:hypothetical protein
MAAIDTPTSRAGDELAADAEWLLENFEPRVDGSSFNIEAITAKTGDFSLHADITIKQAKEGDARG